MTHAEHKERHEKLHRMLDELTADFIRHNSTKRLGSTTIMELVTWSYEQTREPTAPPSGETAALRETPATEGATSAGPCGGAKKCG